MSRRLPPESSWTTVMLPVILHSARLGLPECQASHEARLSLFFFCPTWSPGALAYIVVVGILDRRRCFRRKWFSATYVFSYKSLDKVVLATRSYGTTRDITWLTTFFVKETTTLLPSDASKLLSTMASESDGEPRRGIVTFCGPSSRCNSVYGNSNPGVVSNPVDGAT